MATVKAAFSPKAAYQFKITLEGSQPSVWRRIRVPGGFDLFRLHMTIQAAMGWLNCHLHQFDIEGKLYSIPSPEDIKPVLDERRYSLWLVVPREGMSFSYRYDYGDNWRHLVEVEEILSPDSKFKRPVCLDGSMSCPLEDVGGVGGYACFLKAIHDPTHKCHSMYVEWMGDRKFDPEAFDLDEANARLEELNFKKAAMQRWLHQ